jgi:hypothetical protein
MIGQTLDLPFHNTLELAGPALAEAHAKAKSQEERILEYFQRSSPGATFTPEYLLPLMPRGTPLTSVRRAMTNLTTAGHLEKVPLGQKRTRGKLGKPVHSWTLR